GRLPHCPRGAARSRGSEAPQRSTEPIGSRPYPPWVRDLEWRERPSPAEVRALREGATERPGPRESEEGRPAGSDACEGCRAELVTASTQFAARCGWPAFYAPAASDAVELLEDPSLGMRRSEVRCARCGSHLGHVFEGEGFPTPTDQRYCINSISLVHSDDASA